MVIFSLLTSRRIVITEDTVFETSSSYKNDSSIYTSPVAVVLDTDKQTTKKPTGDKMLSRVVDCLQKTKQNITLEYPEDAMLHFQDIHRELELWTQRPGHKPHEYAGYGGPWIENFFISHFEGLLNNASSLQEVFGPYIPLFVPWTDVWVKNGNQYPDAMGEVLHKSLRKNVPYIAVCQNDNGFVGLHDLFILAQEKFQITVLSGGGYGHVPVPLLKQPEDPIRNRKSMSDRKYFMSYVGSDTNAPQDMRRNMIRILESKLASSFYHGKSPMWRDYMAKSKISLAPRGYGRSAFHFMEALQMGLIPVQVYLDNDIPWIPYGAKLAGLVYATDLQGLPSLVDHLLQLSNEDLKRKEEVILSMRDSHFTFEAVMWHIQGFLLGDGTSDLVCQRLPDSARGPAR